MLRTKLSHTVFKCPKVTLRHFVVRTNPQDILCLKKPMNDGVHEMAASVR